MPGTAATGSTKIAILDSRIYADLCAGKFYVDVSPTTYIGSGATTVLGANVQITNPSGVIVKPFGTNYEIAPDLSGGMDAVIAFDIPTQAGNYQYGSYIIEVEMFDDSGSYTVTKTLNICVPDKNKKQRKYGSLSAILKGVCKDGKLYVIVDGVPTYKGKTVESQTQELTLLYPTVSEKEPEVTSLLQFTVLLFEGVYKITGEICATYNLGDNLYVKVNYKVKKEKEIRCLIDPCCVFQALSALHLRITSDCTDKEKEETASITVDALRLYETAQLAGECGEDASEYISELEALLGCKCTCNCAEGTPIIPSAASSMDFDIQGCNVTKEVVGLSTIFTIENYEYKVDIVENGGALTVTTATLADCTKTQVITFNISTVYSQIRTLANASNTEGEFWASIVNKALRDVDPTCLDYTQEQWAALTLPQKMAAMIVKMCACCSCDAEAEVTDVTVDGADVILEWTEAGSVFSVDVYMDGIFQGSVLAGVLQFRFVGQANGQKHIYSLIAKCSDGNQIQPQTGEFEELGCPELAAPTFSGSRDVTAPCPYDLTALVLTLPVGTVAVWKDIYGADVPDPTAVIGGTYYAFSKDGNNCYSSTGMAFKVTCDEEAENCTAPQNLDVIDFGGMSHLVRFQSAAYPPPGNSYTVKRRLSADADVDGNYTTIGTPTYDLGMARWIINDASAVDNTLYTYKAQSNCGDSPQTTPSIQAQYVYIVCPSLTLTPGDTTIDYSFAPVGGSVTRYYVEIYDSTGLTLIETDTHDPAFPDPITGIFEYLSSGTEYSVKVRMVFGSYTTKQCEDNLVTTTAP